jgi:hypothetical protein
MPAGTVTPRPGRIPGRMFVYVCIDLLTVTILLIKSMGLVRLLW